MFDKNEKKQYEKRIQALKRLNIPVTQKNIKDTLIAPETPLPNVKKHQNKKQEPYGMHSRIFGYKILFKFIEQIRVEEEGFLYKGKIIKWGDILKIEVHQGTKKSAGRYNMGPPLKRYRLLVYETSNIPTVCIESAIIQQGDKYLFVERDKTKAFSLLEKWMIEKIGKEKSVQKSNVGEISYPIEKIYVLCFVLFMLGMIFSWVYKAIIGAPLN